MSHTGTVIKPNQSPGIIRVVTLGAAISIKEPEILNIIVPTKNSERYVVLLNSGKKHNYGDAVMFNLKKFENIDIHEEDKKIYDEFQNEIDGYIVEIRKKHSHYKPIYYANDVEDLPTEALLHPFYQFIRSFEEDTIEKILASLRNVKIFLFDRKTDINFMNERFENICGIQLVTADETDGTGLKSRDEEGNLIDNDTYKNNWKEHYLVVDYKDTDGVLAEIARSSKKEHRRSTYEEIPKFIKSGPHA